MKRPLGSFLPAVALVPLLLFLLPVQHALGLWRHAVSEPRCPADVIVVMGAAQYDGQPSPVFARRLDRALELYRGGCAPSILVTGGKRDGDRFTEGEAGARYLSGRGVPEGALLSETASRSSLENLRLSLPQLAGRRVLIVTDDMHAYRSRWLASRLGLEAHVAPVPSGGARLAYAAREILTVTAYSVGITVHRWAPPPSGANPRWGPAAPAPSGANLRWGPVAPAPSGAEPRWGSGPAPSGAKLP